MNFTTLVGEGTIIGVTRDKIQEPVGEGGAAIWPKEGWRARRNMAVVRNYCMYNDNAKE
jgi:hypothetical protein